MGDIVMNEKPRFVIAEDHAILRQGLKSLMRANRGFQVVGEAEDGLEAIRCVERTKPDILLLDLNMPKMDGISVIKEIKKRYPDVRIVVLTMHKAEEYVLQAFQSGVDGYCLKSSSFDELTMAIRAVLEGKRYVCPDVSERILWGYLKGRNAISRKSSWDAVTPRERQVLRLIAKGYKNKGIADHLCISVKTVEKHRANVMRKLDLHSASALTAIAIEKGLIVRDQ